MLNLT
jgi:hypothetical protein